MSDIFVSYASSLGARPRIGAGLPSSFELDPFDLLERQLAEENDKRDSLSAVAAWLASRAHDFHPVWPKSISHWSRSGVISSAATHDVLLVLVCDPWRSLARSLETLEELSDQLPEFGEAMRPPRPDPQPVDVQWLDQLSSVAVRESSDLYSWYASTEEE